MNPSPSSYRTTEPGSTCTESGLLDIAFNRYNRRRAARLAGRSGEPNMLPPWYGSRTMKKGFSDHGGGFDPAAYRLSLARRQFFRDCGVGVGKIALASLLVEASGGSVRADAGRAPGSSGAPAGSQ